MPRTKQPRKPKITDDTIKQRMDDYIRLSEMRSRKFNDSVDNYLSNLEVRMLAGVNQFPEDVQNMTLTQLFTPDPPPSPEKKKVDISPESRSTRTTKLDRPSRATAISDDGYHTESSAASKKSRATRQTSQKRASSQKRARSPSLSRTVGPKRSRTTSTNRESKMTSKANTTQKPKDGFTTPDKKPTIPFTITPKIKMNSACHFLRKPKDGEMVFSSQGSPLMVSTNKSEKTANVQFPSSNGNIISLLPLDQTISERLTLDEDTRKQLLILQKHLSKVTRSNKEN